MSNDLQLSWLPKFKCTKERKLHIIKSISDMQDEEFADIIEACTFFNIFDDDWNNEEKIDSIKREAINVIGNIDLIVTSDECIAVRFPGMDYDMLIATGVLSVKFDLIQAVITEEMEIKFFEFAREDLMEASNASTAVGINWVE